MHAGKHFPCEPNYYTKKRKPAVHAVRSYFKEINCTESDNGCPLFEVRSSETGNKAQNARTRSHPYPPLPKRHLPPPLLNRILVAVHFEIHLKSLADDHVIGQSSVFGAG
jgi:hypothetical protein